MWSSKHFKLVMIFQVDQLNQLYKGAWKPGSPSIDVSHTPYFVDEFFQQQVISLIASREKQAYSAVTGVGGYNP